MSTQAEKQANNYVAPGSAGEASATNANTSSTPPNVRHIPIFVEGRDEPLINRNHDTAANTSAQSPNTKSSNSSGQHQHQQHSAHPYNINRSSSGAQSSDGPFDWSKKFPRMGGQQSSGGHQRSDSPHRTVPMAHGSTGNGVGPQHGHQSTPQWQQQHSQGFSQTDGGPAAPQSQRTPHQQTQSQQQHQTQEPSEPASQVNPDLASIAKIQKIQKDVLDLMDQVESFTGNTRKDRQYLYLDEMLTQNLLKLDTIDTDGKDNIKMARREAIKCINKCISVLEAKADSGQQQAQQQRNAATAV